MNPVFPFNAEFQRKIVKLALFDDSFCAMAMKHLEAGMFESDSLQWAWTQLSREKQEGRVPTLAVLYDRVRDVEEVLQPRYQAMVQAIDREVVQEDPYIRDRLSEFIRRNLFVAAYADARRIYNMNRPDEAMALMYEQTKRIHDVRFDAPDRSWFYDDWGDRLAAQRIRDDRDFDFTFPTGIRGIDEVLKGGLSKGELGIWIADAKAGKSTMLVHHAAFTARQQRNVLMVILEGSRLQTESRLDAYHAKQAYHEVQRGRLDAQTFQQLQIEYRMLRQKMVVRAMVDKWSYSVADIRAELDDLKSTHGWIPDMIVVDYGDLLRSQTAARSEEEHQRNAFSDLKSLSTQDYGYAVWSASQCRRPSTQRSRNEDQKKKNERREWGRVVLEGGDIADSYNKIRRVDFVGSINQDWDEKEKGLVRLYAASYRDNKAGKVVLCKQDMATMTFVDLLSDYNLKDLPKNVQAEIARAEAAKAKQAAEAEKERIKEQSAQQEFVNEKG